MCGQPQHRYGGRGVPVLSMHAVRGDAKLDLYMAYKGFGAFYKD